MDEDKIESMEAEIRDRQYKYAASGVVSEKLLDNIAASDNVESLEAAIRHGQTERAKEGYVFPKSLDSIVGSGQSESMEAEIRDRQYKYAASGVVSEKSLDNIAASDNVESLEAAIRHGQTERAKEGAINEGSADNAAVFGNYDKNARVRQLIESAGAKKYFADLAVNPIISNPEEFKAAVAGGINSNEVLDKFFDSYVENFSSAITSSKVEGSSQGNQSCDAKQILENYLNVYSNLIYELKAQEASVDFNKLKFPDEIKDDLLSVQSSLCEAGGVFGMPIPNKCQGYEPMEVMGDAASVINLINGYTPQGFIGRVLGPNPNYVQHQEQEFMDNDACQE